MVHLSQMGDSEWVSAGPSYAQPRYSDALNQVCVCVYGSGESEGGGDR